MTEEDDGAPPTPKKLKMELEEEPNEVLLNNDHHESKDELSSERNQSPRPLLNFPPVSTLPPTPPLPSSPTDLGMEEQYSEDDDGPLPGWDNSHQQTEQLSTPAVISSDVRIEDGPQPQLEAHPDPAPELVPSEQDSEDEGPPPGWDNKYQLEEQIEQLVTPDVISKISSDIKTEDVQQDVRNEGQPKISELNLEEQNSEDEGPPSGWDNSHQLKEQAQHKSTYSSDIKIEDVRQDAQNKEGRPQSQAQVLVSSECEKTDIKVEQQDSEDEGPPPGWDSKFQPEPKRQTTCSTTPTSDLKTENVQEGAQNEDGPQQQSDMKVEEQDSEDEGPPPGWDSKCEPEPNLQTTHPTTSQSDIKTEDIQQNARNEDGPQPHSQAHPSSAPELAPSDMKVEEQDLEDDGPPPGWDSKYQPEPELKPEPEPQSESTPKLLVTGPTTSPSVQKDVKIVEEIFLPSTRQHSLPPTKRQILVPKPPTAIDYPEMGQMVCGSCRHLLSYPRGARYVECACCLEENYVLEEHEVGQVICGGCNVLLMYPYGAPKVRCANCSIETEIGDQNRRPALSEHQSRARRHLKRVHAG